MRPACSSNRPRSLARHRRRSSCWVGLSHGRLRDLTAAERIFERLNQASPSEPGFASLLTLALVDQDDPDKRARGLLLAEVNAKKFPKALDVQASLGRAQARSSHLDEAERVLRADNRGSRWPGDPDHRLLFGPDPRREGSNRRSSQGAYASHSDAHRLRLSVRRQEAAGIAGSKEPGRDRAISKQPGAFKALSCCLIKAYHPMNSEASATTLASGLSLRSWA